MQQTRTITIEQARQFILIKQGLIGSHQFKDKAGVLSFVRQAGCLQFDPIDICGRNADLILFSRIEHYDKNMLDELLYKDRLLVDQWDKVMSIYAVSDWAAMTRQRERNKNYYERNLESHMDLVAYVLKKLEENESVRPNDLEIDLPSHFFTWRHKNLGQAILDALYFSGKAVIHHRDGVKRYFGLTSKYIDASFLNQKDPFTTESDFHKFQIKRRIGAVGMLHAKSSDAYLGLSFKTPARRTYIKEMLQENELIEIHIEGIAEPVYILAADEKLLQEKAVDKRIEFIAPLDSFIWDRKLIKSIFDFEYRWEIYHVPEKRQFAPYALPILYGTDLIGQIEMAVDRKTKTLVVKNIWYKNHEQDKQFKKALDRKIAAFSKFNNCLHIDQSKTSIHIYD